MRERVNVVQGKNPVLVIAPHGADALYTDLIASLVAEKANCYAVINQGFKRSETVDVNRDYADCDRVGHCTQDVVYDEFLKPILKIRNKVAKATFNATVDDDIAKKLLIVHIQGCSDAVHREANEQVDVIVGYGLGRDIDSLSCRKWRKNLLVDFWRNSTNWGEVYEGSGSGPYAGRDSNCLNQYFRKHQLDRRVESIQLTFPESARCSRRAAAITAATLVVLLKYMLQADDYKQIPVAKVI